VLVFVKKKKEKDTHKYFLYVFSSETLKTFNYVFHEDFAEFITF